MDNALEKVFGFIGRHRLLEGARGIVVAVSGGADSVALLDMLTVWLAETRREGGNSESALTPAMFLHVAHLDHQLRGEESEGDAEFVRELAESYQVPITVSAVDVRGRARKAGLGIEEAAREARYRFLFSLSEQLGFDRIAAGHTMNDQAETFLMRLVRGAGPRGLAAMRPFTKAHAFGTQREERLNAENIEGKTPSDSEHGCLDSFIIRPLLSINREEVEQYCRTRRLAFRTDSTNFDTSYTRNHVRMEVLPALNYMNPKAVEHIARAAELIAGQEEMLDLTAVSLLDEARVNLRKVEGEASYTVSAFLRQPEALRRRMIIEAARQAGFGQDSGPVSGEILYVHVVGVEKLLEEGASGRRVMLAGGIEVWREFNALTFRRVMADQAARLTESSDPCQVSAARPQVYVAGWSISLTRGEPPSALRSLLESARAVHNETGRDWTVAILDDGLLPERLVVRPRQRGEQVRVTNHRRSKKLKSLMIDFKIPVGRRASWPVVVTAEGGYVWSPGLPPAAAFAARNDSASLAVLRAEMEE